MARLFGLCLSGESLMAFPTPLARLCDRGKQAGSCWQQSAEEGWLGGDSVCFSSQLSLVFVWKPFPRREAG